MSKRELRVGDVIACDYGGPRRPSQPTVTILRLITDVRPTGYTWEYLDLGADRPDDEPQPDFISENSSDPFFELGWRLVCRGAYRP